MPIPMFIQSLEQIGANSASNIRVKTAARLTDEALQGSFQEQVGVHFEEVPPGTQYRLEQFNLYLSYFQNSALPSLGVMKTEDLQTLATAARQEVGRLMDSACQEAGIRIPPAVTLNFQPDGSITAGDHPDRESVDFLLAHNDALRESLTRVAVLDDQVRCQQEAALARNCAQRLALAGFAKADKMVLELMNKVKVRQVTMRFENNSLTPFYDGRKLSERITDMRERLESLERKSLGMLGNLLRLS